MPGGRVVSYLVLSPVQHARRRYEAGDTVKLTAGDAATLIAADVVADSTDTAADASPAPAGGAEEGREAALRAAIAGLEPGRDDHWTRDGRPEVRALREASGLDDVSAAERDAAWAARREPAT